MPERKIVIIILIYLIYFAIMFTIIHIRYKRRMKEIDEYYNHKKREIEKIQRLIKEIRIGLAKELEFAQSLLDDKTRKE